MNDNNGLTLIAPRITPALDPFFRPAVLAERAFREQARATGHAVPVELALEQADGSVFHFQMEAFPDGHPQAAGNATCLERKVKFMLWSRGGFRIHLKGPRTLGEALQRHYREKATGKFDSEIIGTRIYDHAI